MAGGRVFSITTLLLLRPTHPRLFNREQLSCRAWPVLQDLPRGIMDPCNIVQCLVIAHLHFPLLSRLPKILKIHGTYKLSRLSLFFHRLPRAGQKLLLSGQWAGWFTILVWTKIFQQMLDGLPWNPEKMDHHRPRRMRFIHVGGEHHPFPFNTTIRLAFVVLRYNLTDTFCSSFALISYKVPGRVKVWQIHNRVNKKTNNYTKRDTEPEADCTN